jgi:hypothetical protein
MRSQKMILLLVCLVCSLIGAFGCGPKPVTQAGPILPQPYTSGQMSTMADNINANPYLSAASKAKMISGLKQMNQQRTHSNTASAPPPAMPRQ